MSLKVQTRTPQSDSDLKRKQQTTLHYGQRNRRRWSSGAAPSHAPHIQKVVKNPRQPLASDASSWQIMLLLSSMLLASRCWTQRMYRLHVSSADWWITQFTGNSQLSILRLAIGSGSFGYGRFLVRATSHVLGRVQVSPDFSYSTESTRVPTLLCIDRVLSNGVTHGGDGDGCTVQGTPLIIGSDYSTLVSCQYRIALD